MAASANHYSTLGVPKNATAEQVKHAYNKLALRHHPDKGGSHNDFLNIQEAWEILRDPLSRKDHDLRYFRLLKNRHPEDNKHRQRSGRPDDSSARNANKDDLYWSKSTRKPEYTQSSSRAHQPFEDDRPRTPTASTSTHTASGTYDSTSDKYHFSHRKTSDNKGSAGYHSFGSSFSDDFNHKFDAGAHSTREFKFDFKAGSDPGSDAADDDAKWSTYRDSGSSTRHEKRSHSPKSQQSVNSSRPASRTHLPILRNLVKEAELHVAQYQDLLLTLRSAVTWEDIGNELWCHVFHVESLFTTRHLGLAMREVACRRIDSRADGGTDAAIPPPHVMNGIRDETVKAREGLQRLKQFFEEIIKAAKEHKQLQKKRADSGKTTNLDDEDDGSVDIVFAIHALEIFVVRYLSHQVKDKLGCMNSPYDHS